jgi:soluble lytic murein transglycosylase-like protein
MIIRIASLYNVPPYLMVAIAEVESKWNVEAVNVNTDGTIDRGLMQLNSSWFNDDGWADPEVSITHAAVLIQELRDHGLTWWQVAVAYNCGIGRIEDPPASSVEYAVRLFELWASYDRSFYQYIGR